MFALLMLVVGIVVGFFVGTQMPLKKKQDTIPRRKDVKLVEDASKRLVEKRDDIIIDTNSVEVWDDIKTIIDSLKD